MNRSLRFFPTMRFQVGTLFTCLLLCGFLLSGNVIGQTASVRLWEDASGKFQVRAQLLEHAQGKIRLRTADGREITVPFERLSRKDQEYLKSLDAPQDNPFAGGTPAAMDADLTAAAVPDLGSSFQLSSSLGDRLALPLTGTTIDLSGPVIGGFRPDPAAVPDGPADGSVKIAQVDPYEKVSKPLIAGRDGTTMLVGVGRIMAGKPEQTRGRIYAVGWGTSVADLVWDKATALQLLDHDRALGQSLLVDQLDMLWRGGELGMVEGLERGSPKPLYWRTLSASSPGFAPQFQWARLLGNGHALVIVSDTLYLWDLPAARLIYRVEGVGANPPPTLSPGGRYLAIPTTQGATILQTDTGELCGRVAFTNLKPGLAFHNDGKQLLLCSGNQYLVWDCQDQQVTAQATTTDHLGNSPLNWVGPKMFRSQLGSLVHIDLGMAIWKYSLSSTTDPQMIGDKLLFATTSQQATVISASIPHAAAEASLQRLLKGGDAVMLVRPGSEVAVSIQSAVDGVESEQIEQALGIAVERAGWKVSSGAPITLVANIGRGKPQELSYRKMEASLNDARSTATLHPFTMELEIRRGNQVLWQRASTNHVPFLLRLQEGETVQDAVKRYEKPDPQFFARLHLPPRIPKPEISSEVGRSILVDGAWKDMRLDAVPSSRARTRFGR